MRAQDLDSFVTLLRKHTGVAIGPDKAYLIESRLGPVARRHGLASSHAVIAAIRVGTNLALVRDALDAMMTHESFFFRDGHPFDEFRRLVLPDLIERRAKQRHLRIWCAAASTGQEPYSLAMIVHEEAAGLAGWTVEIVATDIAAGALAYARDGLYTRFEVQRGLSIQQLVKHFTREGENWRLDAAIRARVAYREFNLLDSPAALGIFDVVLCRNVLIYFDQTTKAEVLARIAGQMSEGGYLFLGGAETVIGITDRFAPLPGRHGIYTPVGRSAAPSAAARTETRARRPAHANG